MAILKTNYGQEGWVPGTAGSTTGANATNKQVNIDTGAVEANTLLQIHQLFAIARIEDDAGVALTNSVYRGFKIEDITDSSGKFNLIDTGAGTTAAFVTDHYQLEASPVTDNTATELANPGFEVTTGWTFSFAVSGGPSATSAQDATWGSKTGSFDWKGEITGNSPGAGQQSRAWATRTVNWTNIAAVQADWEVVSGGGIGSATIGIGGSTAYGDWVVGGQLGQGTASGTDTKVSSETTTGTTFVARIDRSPQAGTGTFTGFIDDIRTFRYVTTTKTVKTVALTASADWATNISHVLVYLEYTPSPKGADTITVDISTDNGATYTTGATFTALSTLSAGATGTAVGHTGFVPITSTLGKQVMLKFNFSHSTGGATAKLYRFGMACLTDGS